LTAAMQVIGGSVPRWVGIWCLCRHCCFC